MLAARVSSWSNAVLGDAAATMVCMEAVALALGLVSVVFLVATLVVYGRARRLDDDLAALREQVAAGAEWLPQITLRTVAVVTPQGTLRGVLSGVYPDALVLSHAQLLGNPTTQLEGDVVIPRGQIRFVQDMPPQLVADPVAAEPDGGR